MLSLWSNVGPRVVQMCGPLPLMLHYLHVMDISMHCAEPAEMLFVKWSHNEACRAHFGAQMPPREEAILEAPPALQSLVRIP